jgi:hypothetical protein
MSEFDDGHEARPPAGRADDEIVRALADFVDDLIEGLGIDLGHLGTDGRGDGASQDPGG